MHLVIEMLSQRLKSADSNHCALIDADRPGRRGLTDRSPLKNFTARLFRIYRILNYRIDVLSHSVKGASLEGRRKDEQDSGISRRANAWLYLLFEY